ncbi:Histidine-rich knob protein-like protein KPRPC [Plasmodium coatneyi]|uniref:Histidine-rich knob protein-like protein KPRPC n=1 Tax=Plasmodium coatneyi TaxID=208452 RepID=A0A1B1E640_9APIC|nr:Histidine-rich knob protein-like protein KPRPC [Plasmodium coatneyi]ANQ10465.1 Histidine-rich knob protein-like protein KPRPC [Plasmodium coatneyi]
MAIFKGYNATEKINISQFLCRTFFVTLLIWFLNCSNYQKCDGRSDLQSELKPTTSRSLSVVRRMGKYNPPLRTRVVKEVTRGGFKEYEEKYESKHYTLKENVDEKNKDCDEKYEAANYGFREKCPYEVNPYTGANGPDILLLKKRFHETLNRDEDDDDDDEALLSSKLPGSLDACEGGYGGKKKRRSKADDEYPTIIKEYEEVGAQGYNRGPGGRGKGKKRPTPHGPDAEEYPEEDMGAYGPPPRAGRPVKVTEPDDDEMMAYGPPTRGRGPVKTGQHGAPGPSKDPFKDQPHGNFKKGQAPTVHQGPKQPTNGPKPPVNQQAPPKPTVSQQAPPKPTVSQQAPPKPTVNEPPKKESKKDKSKKDKSKKNKK